MEQPSKNPISGPIQQASLEPYSSTLLGQIDAKVLSTQGGRIALTIIVIAALLIPSVQFVKKIQETEVSLWREGGMRHRTALGRWLPTAALLNDAENTTNPYGVGHWFPTPPMVLTSIAPLARLDYAAAGVVWSVLKIAGLALSMIYLLRGLNRPEMAIPIGVLAATLVFSIRPIVSDITHGNLNIFMMVWLTLAWGLYIRNRDFLAGILVALAVVTKITPALVIVYFLYKRAWRVCAGAGVGLILFFVVLPGLALGFDRNQEYLVTWFDMLVRPFAVDGYVTKEIANQSLYGISVRLLSNAGILAIEHMPDDIAAESGMEYMVKPATFAGRLLKPAIGLLVVGTLTLACRVRSVARKDPRRLIEFGLILLAMLLLSERTWKHHATTLPIVFLGTWIGLTCFQLTDRFRAWFVAGLGVQLFLLVGTSEGILSDSLADKMLDGGFFGWGLLLCFVQLTLLLRAVRPRPHP